MTTEQVALDRDALRKVARKGIIAAAWLTVLSLIEYTVFAMFDGESFLTLALLPFVLAKGWIILDVFMHIRALWSEEH